MYFIKIVFLPFAYTIDQFRWGLFNQSIPLEKMNEAWWQLREKYQVYSLFAELDLRTFLGNKSSCHEV